MLTTVWAREWQYKELLSDLDDQVWTELSDDWQKFLSEKEVPPCEPTLRAARVNATNFRL